MLPSDRYLVDLDSLLDTRLGLLSTMVPDIITTKQFKESYLSRMSDDFSAFIPDWDHEAWLKRWATRDGSVLPHSAITGMVWLILDLVTGVNATVNTPEEQTLSITLNLYPYKIPEDVADELRAGFSELFPKVKIETMSLDPTFLTPSHLFTKFTGYICYRFDLWVNLHIDALTHLKKPSFDFYVPSILASNTKTGEKIFRTGMAQQMQCELFAGVLGIKWYDLREFSIRLSPV